MVLVALVVLVGVSIDVPPYPDASQGPLSLSGVSIGPTAVHLLAGGVRFPAPSWYIASDETASSAATLAFLVPPTCGPVSILVTRGLNAQPYTPGPASGAVVGAQLQVHAPTIQHVGDPVVNITTSACPRVAVDGTGLGLPGDERLLNISVWSAGVHMGSCDDIMVVAANHRLTCRLPLGIQPGSSLRFSNRCGQTADDVPGAYGSFWSMTASPSLSAS